MRLKPLPAQLPFLPATPATMAPVLCTLYFLASASAAVETGITTFIDIHRRFRTETPKYRSLPVTPAGGEKLEADETRAEYISQ